MNSEDFNKYLEKVNNNISAIYNAFYLWKNINNEKYNNIYNRYKYFWMITIVSLQFYYLFGIAKLFEKSNKKRKKEVISIPFLLEFIPDGKDKEKIKKEIDEQKPFLKNVKQWRNKILAHQNKHVAVTIENFYKKHPIQGKQIEKLLSSASKILGMIESTTTNNKSKIHHIYLHKEMSKRDLDSIMSKLSKDLGVFKRI